MKKTVMTITSGMTTTLITINDKDIDDDVGLPAKDQSAPSDDDDDHDNDHNDAELDDDDDEDDLRAGRVVAVLGASGGTKITTAVAQVINVNVIIAIAIIVLANAQHSL